MTERRAAHRGDLVIIEIADPNTITAYDIATVTSVTRDGDVKAARPADGARSVPLTRWRRRHPRYGQIWVIPADRIDVEAAIRTANEHHEYDTPHAAAPYPDRQAVLDALLPHRLACQPSSDAV